MPMTHLAYPRSDRVLAVPTAALLQDYSRTQLEPDNHNKHTLLFSTQRLHQQPFPVS